MKRFASFLLGGALLAAAPLFAAAPVFTNNFVSVTLDGVRLGTDTDPSNYSMFPSVVYDASSGLFHMWVANTNALSIEGLRHATSSDGVHFVSDGNLSFAGGNPFPIYGAPAEPQFEFPRAAKIGDDWKLLIWTENGAPGQYGDYNYNESINDIGVDPSTLAVTHQGPIYPTNGLGTFGQTTGPYGIVNGKLYVADDRIGGVSKWAYDDTTPPSVAPPADTYQDLITGTGYVYFVTHPGDPLGVYVHNVARVLDQGDGTLGVYYSLRHPDGSRVNKQIYYAQSGDGGQTWSAPAGLFPNGDAVRIDGAPNQFDFSHPEVTLVGSRRVLYFSTKAIDGAFVVATSAAQAPQVNSWADLLGSSEGAGEVAVGVIRTMGDGHALLAQTHGFDPDNPGFWLVRLDGLGEVVSQALYTAPYAASGPGYTFFPTSLAQAGEGGFVMAGLFAPLPGPMWLMRVDALGNVVWSKTYTTCDGGLCGNSPSAIVPTSDGGFAFAGSGNDSPRFVLGKVDGGGTLEWFHSYPVSGLSTGAVSLLVAPDGGFVVGGAIGTNAADAVYRVLRTDSSGAVSWDEQIGSSGSNVFIGLANGASGEYLVMGTGPNSAIQVVAIDPSGNLLWQKAYTDPELGSIHAIAASETGGAAIAGSRTDGRAFLLGIDDAGTMQWARSFADMTTSHAYFYTVAPTFDGGFLAAGGDADPSFSYSRVLAVKVDTGGEFVGCLDVEVSIPITASTPSLTATTLASSVVDEIPNTIIADLSATSAVTDANERVICRATLPMELSPAALVVDSSGNGIAEPDEQFVTEPSWSNFGLLTMTLTGRSSSVSDSNGLETSEPDPDADYGLVAPFQMSDCETATGDCYQFGFHNVPRPSQHWDTYVDETLSTSDPHHKWAKRWTIHVGLSFSDVPSSSGFYPFIEDIFHNGITGGCGAGIYCPTNSVTRAQMAVFLLKSKHGASFVPPACNGHFADVACPSLFADWIEELANEGITAGCGGGNYCPDQAVTRQQMAPFLLKTLNGPGYTPQPCEGTFQDVPCSSPFADWIQDLWFRQITAGCSASPLLYCPSDPNTRQQMAVFLTKTFSLLLYGP